MRNKAHPHHPRRRPPSQHLRQSRLIKVNNREVRSIRLPCVFIACAFQNIDKVRYVSIQDVYEIRYQDSVPIE